MNRIISYILAGIVGLLLYGLLFSVSCSAQSPALLSFGAGSSAPAKIYDPLPPRDVSTGVTLLTNTYYVIRIVNNGASSSLTVNNGTPATFSITAQNGSSTPKIGSAYTQTSGNWDGQMGSFFQKSGLLSSGEIADMWSYFGF